MKGKIKVIEGVYPVTRAEAVYVDDETTLNQVIEGNMFGGVSREEFDIAIGQLNSKKITPSDLSQDVLGIITGDTSVVSCDEHNYKANAEIPLYIQTYVNEHNKALHPKVLYFPDRFANFKFFMCYSPMPERYENPCIAVANTPLKWYMPQYHLKFNNPLDSIEDITSSEQLPVGYNSDPHLVFNTDLNRLECWYRYYCSSDGQALETIYRRTTEDGRTWTPREKLYQVASSNGIQIVCPTVLYENGIYKIWVSCDRQKIKYYESVNGKDWIFKSDTNIYAWHFDIIKTDLGYEFVGGGGSVVHAVSSDGLLWTDKKVILGGGKPYSWDSSGCYRPSLLKFNGKYYLYYSVYNGPDVIYIGLSISENEDITTLRGLPYSSIYHMNTENNGY